MKHRKVTKEQETELVCTYRDGFPNMTVERAAIKAGIPPKTAWAVLKRNKSTFQEIARERGGKYFKRYGKPLPSALQDKLDEIKEDVEVQKREIVTPYGTIRTDSQLSITLEDGRMEIEFQ